MCPVLVLSLRKPPLYAYASMRNCSCNVGLQNPAKNCALDGAHFATAYTVVNPDLMTSRYRRVQRTGVVDRRAGVTVEICAPTTDHLRRYTNVLCRSCACMTVSHAALLEMARGVDRFRVPRADANKTRVSRGHTKGVYYRTCQAYITDQVSGNCSVAADVFALLLSPIVPSCSERML
jgi:hypothetical protein